MHLLPVRKLGRLPRPDIVHFRGACRGTEIFLRELTLLNTLSSNPKSFRSVADLAFSYKISYYFIFTNFMTNFFFVQRHG